MALSWTVIPSHSLFLMTHCNKCNLYYTRNCVAHPTAGSDGGDQEMTIDSSTRGQKRGLVDRTWRQSTSRNICCAHVKCQPMLHKDSDCVSMTGPEKKMTQLCLQLRQLGQEWESIPIPFPKASTLH